MKELMHNIPCGKIGASLNGAILNGADIYFKTDSEDIVYLTRVQFNKDNNSFEILVFADPNLAGYSNRFEVKISDIEDAISCPF